MCESQAWFRHLQRWQAGIEGTISTLNRQHGLGRARVLGRQAVHWWVGAGIFAQDLKQLARVYGLNSKQGLLQDQIRRRHRTHLLPRQISCLRAEYSSEI